MQREEGRVRGVAEHGGCVGELGGGRGERRRFRAEIGSAVRCSMYEVSSLGSNRRVDSASALRSSGQG